MHCNKRWVLVVCICTSFCPNNSFFVIKFGSCLPFVPLFILSNHIIPFQNSNCTPNNLLTSLSVSILVCSVIRLKRSMFVESVKTWKSSPPFRRSPSKCLLIPHVNFIMIACPRTSCLICTHTHIYVIRYYYELVYKQWCLLFYCSVSAYRKRSSREIFPAARLWWKSTCSRATGTKMICTITRYLHDILCC